MVFVREGDDGQTNLGCPLAVYFALLLLEVSGNYEINWMKATVPKYSLFDLNSTVSAKGNDDGDFFVPPNFYSSLLFNIDEEITSTLFRLWLAVGRWDNVYTKQFHSKHRCDFIDDIGALQETQIKLQRYFYPHKATPRELVAKWGGPGELLRH